MKNKKEIFYTKINTILKIMCQDNFEEFSRLFYAEKSKTSLKHRQIHLKNRWFNAQNPTYPRLFKKEFPFYPFSRLIFNGKRLFKDANAFLEMDQELFYQQIKAYTEEDIILKSELREGDLYRYLYVHNINGIEGEDHIDYYSIEYLEAIPPNEIEISVHAPQHKSALNIEPYYGKLRQHKGKLILSFENRSDYISAIFNLDLTYDHTKYLVGVGVGIADINQKIPIAKKVILTKEPIEKKEELYLILNETEILSAKENSYKFRQSDRNFEPDFFENYIKKVERLNQLFKNLSKEGKFGSFYEQLAFKEFSSSTHILQKIKKNRSYHINNRKRVLDILLKTQPNEQYQQLSMVMPIDKGDNIFEHQSSQALLLQEQFQTLSQSISIEMIFVLPSCQSPLGDEFLSFLSTIHNNIKIYFIFKEEIEQEVNSIDFILTEQKNFLISKFLRVDAPVFNLSLDQNIINEHEAMFRKIRNRSIPYESFFEKGRSLCQSSNPILKNLVGRWYFYLYGTGKFWQDEIHIAKDGTVNSITENGEEEQGEIIHKHYQSLILLEEKKTRRLLTIIFDHQAHQTTHAFSVQVIAKQFKSDLEILTIGLFSRHKMKIEKAQNILGDVNEVRVLEKEDIQRRLGAYLSEKFYI